MSLAPLLGSVAAALVSSHIAFVGGMTTTIMTGISSATTSITIGGNLSGGISSDTLANDLIIMCVGAPSTTDTSGRASSGFSSDYTEYVNSTNDANITVLHKFASGAGESTTFGPHGNNQPSFPTNITIMVFRFVDTTTPFDVALTHASGTTLIVNPPSITPVTTGAVIVAMGMCAGGQVGLPSETSLLTSSDLTGFLSNKGAGTSRSASNGMGYKVWTSGAFDPAAFGQSATSTSSSSWIGVTIALRPKYPG